MHKWDWEYISRGNGWMKEMKLRDKIRESRVSESSHTGSANHRWRALSNKSSSYIPPNQWTCIMPWANLLSEQGGQEAGWGSQGRPGPLLLTPAFDTTCSCTNTHHGVSDSWEGGYCHWLVEQDEGGWSWSGYCRRAGIQLTGQAEGEWMSAGCVGTEPLPEILAGTDSLWPCAVFTP